MSEIKIPLPDKNNSLAGMKIKKDCNAHAELFCSFLAAFLFSGFSAVEGISPFGISFVSCVPFEFCFAAFFGSTLGYFACLPAAEALRYCGGLALCCVMRLAVNKKISFRHSKTVLPLICAAVILITGVLWCAVRGFSVTSVLFIGAESLIGCCTSVLFTKSFSLLSVRIKNGRDSVFLVCSLCLLVLCLSGFTVKGVSAGRIVACIAVMFFAHCKGISGGCISGVCLGVFLSVNSDFSHMLPALSVGGLVAGLLSGYGQILCGAAFCFLAVAASFFGGVDGELFISLTELLISFVVFALIPSARVNAVESLVKERGLINDIKTNTRVAADLSRASDNVYKICEIVNTVSERLRQENVDSEEVDVLSQMKIDEMQRVLTDQFSGIGDFLKELAMRINSSRIYDTSRSAALRGALRDAGIYTDELNYYSDEEGSVTVEISLIDRPFDMDWKKAKKLIEIITKRKFEKPEVEVSAMKTTLTFYQSLPYRLQIGYSKRSAKENAPCGDSVSAAARVDSRGFVLISDGMGTGMRAATDSYMTATVMKKLICSGFSFDSAMKIVNTALIARSSEESIASIDGLEANLFTGEMMFYKAGASCSFVRKKERVVILEKSSLPLGILRDVRFSKARFTAEAGDVILLLSDGVTQSEREWIKDELLSWSTNNMEDLSMHILRLAALKAGNTTPDDMTVVAVKLEKSRECDV